MGLPTQACAADIKITEDALVKALRELEEASLAQRSPPARTISLLNRLDASLTVDERTYVAIVYAAQKHLKAELARHLAGALQVEEDSAQYAINLHLSYDSYGISRNPTLLAGVLSERDQARKLVVDRLHEIRLSVLSKATPIARAHQQPSRH